MCGIVGAIANRDVVPVLVEGLKRLEYRGNATAGIAVVTANEVRRVRRTGRVAEMEAAAIAEGFDATLGIGHTRWATHGGVTEGNAHPHISHGELALVHNGIIENHEAQRERLRALGYEFTSQTDTEVVAHLIHHYRAQGASLLGALQQAVKELEGAYALAVIDQRDPSTMVAARMGCPLLVALGDDFGVGLRGELVAQRAQALALGLVVLDDAVVHQRQFAVADVRMRVEFGDAAMRGPARVADAERGRQPGRLRGGLHLGDAAGPAHPPHAVAADHGDAGGVVAAVFQPLEPVHEQRDHVTVGDGADDSAHAGETPSGKPHV